jgi:nicotinate-nucleotide adenylyltransferase
MTSGSVHLGLFGGTFDPIHNGHLDVADAARRALALDRVILMPANVPPHRTPPHASAAHRFAMVALAIQDRAYLTVSDLEMLSDEPSYTASTLDRLAARGMDTRTLVLITGADAFRDIATWKDYPAILDRARFGVVSRPGTAASSLRNELGTLADRMADGRIRLIDAPTSPVSSTDIRRHLAEGQSIHGLVPAAVAAHIERHRLYGPAPREEASQPSSSL